MRSDNEVICWLSLIVKKMIFFCGQSRKNNSNHTHTEQIVSSRCEEICQRRQKRKQKQQQRAVKQHQNHTRSSKYSSFVVHRVWARSCTWDLFGVFTMDNVNSDSLLNRPHNTHKTLWEISFASLFLPFCSLDVILFGRQAAKLTRLNEIECHFRFVILVFKCILFLIHFYWKTVFKRTDKI